MTWSIKYCCFCCKNRDNCKSLNPFCSYATGSHNFIRHRENGDCVIENMVCTSWYEKDGKQTDHKKCWEKQKYI